MEKHTVLPINKRNAARSLLPGIMFVFTLFSIAAALKNNSFRDGYVGLVVSVNILGLIFLTLLAWFMLAKAEEPTIQLRYFMLFLLNIYIANLFCALANSFYQIPGSARPSMLLYTACYFFSMGIYLTLWLYQKLFLRESVSTRVVTVLISVALVIYTASLIVNLFRPVLFRVTAQGVFDDSVKDYASMVTAFFCLILLFIATLLSSLNRSRKLSFLCCIFAPALFATLSVNHSILRDSIYVWGLMSYIVLLPLGLYFFNAHDELENDVLRNEKEQTQLRIAAMMSQMQPHFLYNSLAVIAALCEEDPKLAAEATNAFSNYLRENMDFADKSNPISFSEELDHIKTYVWLEKLRFPNKLKIEYDINCTAFPVPALSVQPMVENAIKHGICKSKSGGTVRISSFETDPYYCVTVFDDGTGFDVRNTLDDSRQHLGINNTRYRIREMAGGSLDIVSAPGEGTTVTIKIPK